MGHVEIRAKALVDLARRPRSSYRIGPRYLMEWVSIVGHSWAFYVKYEILV